MPARMYSLDWHDHIMPVPWSGCWLWDGEVLKGYGTHRLDNKQRPVHRLAWEEANGPIPKGLFVCHHCDVKLCCNPDHLFLGTAKDNATDLYNKGLGYQARITHCPNGHEYTPENTYFLSKKRKGSNARYCRTCHLERMAVTLPLYRAKNRDALNKKAREYQRRKRALLKCQG